MRRKLFWWVSMFLLLVGAVWLASNNQGYVLIVRSPYRVQFSFNFLLVLIVIGFLLLHYALRLVLFLRRLPATKRNKKESQRLIASNEALLEGMHALAEGDFVTAELATKRAHDLIRDANEEIKLSKLLETIATEKQKQGFLFK